MTGLLENITGFSFLGAFVAFLVAALVLKFSSIRLTLVLGAAGLLGGWAGMMMYIFLTGGIYNENIWAVFIPVVLSLLFCYVVLRVNKIKIKFYKPKWATDRGISIILFGLLMVMIIFTALPLSSGVESSVSIKIEENDAPGTRITEGFTLLKYKNGDIKTAEVESSFLTMEIQKASVRFPRIAEDPEEGQYVDFSVTFTVSNANWEKPFIKIVVFEDKNENGLLDTGDELWSYGNIRIKKSSGLWRTWFLYGPSGTSDPWYQMNMIPFSGGSYWLMPIFSAQDGQFEKVWDDSGKTFLNTPEEHTSPDDGMSMQIDENNYLTFIEDGISGFTGYNSGSSATIDGKIFCPTGSSGSHGLLIQAFDQRYTSDMFDNDATPLASKVKTFTITSNGGGGGNGNGGGQPGIDISFTSWAILGVLGVACVVGSAATLKYGAAFIKP